MTQLWSEADRQLLVWALPNEIVNGVGYEHFEAALGMTEDEYVTLIGNLRSDGRTFMLSRQEAVLMRTSLSEVIGMLANEFQTRTGYSDSEAENLRKRLDAFMNQEELVAE
ncbi:hypothetical protein [Terriglobus roseus]|uniref:Uncharacterized protein n=1 Tax=Terriglobus roseus TaxID=392734 RepID=A0A1G7QZ89_9BACT|nr:hypothetical protein [Terriglobus roseus]SDG03000.1 hypothetical protein SAMN05444167_4034 [Terriglobus roseus]